MKHERLGYRIVNGGANAPALGSRLGRGESVGDMRSASVSEQQSLSPAEDVARPDDIALIDGWGINIPDLETAISSITAAARMEQGFCVFTLNLDHLVKLRTLPAFREAYSRATFVTADGAPVAALARRQSPSIQRATGADLVLPLAQACADNGLSVFLFGTSADVLAEVALRLNRHCEGRLEIAGTFAPPEGFDAEGPAADAAIARIAASGAHVCLVALGAPKQEIFAARAVARGADTGFVCIGAGLDFIAGSQVRAPRVLRASGLEWLWRLTTNPRRLGARYARCALLLARLVVFEPWWRPSTNPRPR